MSGAAEQRLVPEANSAVDLLIQVIAGEELLFIKPAADTMLLKRVVQAAGEGLIFVTVANKAGIILHWCRTKQFDDSVSHIDYLSRFQRGVGEARSFNLPVVESATPEEHRWKLAGFRTGG